VRVLVQVKHYDEHKVQVSIVCAEVVMNLPV